MSAWPVQSGIEYWVDVQLIWCFQCFNIGWYVSLTCEVMHWILSRYSANLMFPVFSYWMVCQPDQCSQALNIESMFSLSDVFGVSILDGMSAWPVNSCIEYWVDVQLIRCFQCFNIGWVCQPDQHSQALNIESMFSLSDVSGVSILDGMSAWPVNSCIEYWVNVQLIWCFQCFNIGWVCQPDQHSPRHWILSQMFSLSDVSGVSTMTTMTQQRLQSRQQQRGGGSRRERGG